MSTPINDGGSAFPGTKGVSGYGNCEPVTLPDGSRGWTDFSQGMSLRDWFAGQSIGQLARHAMVDGWARSGPEWRDGVAEEAYKFADAMIAAREGPKP